MLEDGEYQYYSHHGQDGQWASEFVVIHTWYIISGKCLLSCMSGLEQRTTRLVDSPVKEQGVLQPGQCESHQVTPAVYHSTQVAPGLPVCRWSLHHHTFGNLCFQPDLWFTPKQVYGDPRRGCCVFVTFLSLIVYTSYHRYSHTWNKGRWGIHPLILAWWPWEVVHSICHRQVSYCGPGWTYTEVGGGQRHPVSRWTTQHMDCQCPFWWAHRPCDQCTDPGSHNITPGCTAWLVDKQQYPPGVTSERWCGVCGSGSHLQSQPLQHLRTSHCVELDQLIFHPQCEWPWFSPQGPQSFCHRLYFQGVWRHFQT